MKLLARILTSLLPLALLPPAISQTAVSNSNGTFSITGTVVSSTTGAPVPNCRISANRINNPANPGISDTGLTTPGSNRNFNPGGQRRTSGPEQQTVTDDRGHFTLFVISAGAWSLRASATGYLTQAYDEHELYSTTVVLTYKAPTYNLVYHLTPEAAITGVVLDEAGEPVRQAHIAAYSLPSLLTDSTAGIFNSRSFQGNTDDRGHYEIAGLAPGNYRLSVQAHPWYASAGQVLRPSNTANPPIIDDPSIDAVYPVTWFPGTSDENSAVTIVLHDGETSQADIHLTPMPSVHLTLPLPTPTAPSGQGGRQPFYMPHIESVGTGNNFGFQPHITNSNGQVDIGGLAPGIYRVSMPNPNGEPGSSSTIQIGPNSSRLLDLASASANSATVTIQADGPSGADSLPIEFVDASNPRNIYRENRGGPGGFGPGPGGNFGPEGNFGQRPAPLSQTNQDPSLQPVAYQRGRAQSSGDPRQLNGEQRPQRERPPRTVDLPPGDYLVFQQGSSNYFLTGLTLGTKDIPGRLVSIPAGTSTLTVHIGAGRASISGFATLASKASVGAMVVLVPITLGQPGSITEIRRDQSNTDGSFDLPNVIPGQYILIAIDHGWNVNWRDAATLANYLTHGIPLDLRTPAAITQNLDAQLP
jgi:uncharacterized GH25 family protein